MRLFVYAALALALIFSASSVRAQTADAPVRARAAVDSSYAVALEVERLAEVIRTGESLAPHFPDGGLGSAISALMSAARGRGRPRAELPGVWDFRLEVIGVESAAEGGLIVNARAYMATDPQGRDAAVKLRFTREGTAWVLAGHDGLVQRLRAITQRLGRNR